MAEQHKDPGGQWHKKNTVGQRRITHRVTIPLPPQWTEVKLAHLPESSRFRLLYDASGFDPLGQGPVGLSNIVRFPHLLLPPSSPEWKQFGFTVFRNEDSVVPRLGVLVSVKWQFALEWKRSRSAWDAMLFSLEHLHPKVFSLPPAYIIPALFVACMADHPDDELLSATLTAWGPVLREMCQALDPLLQALYHYWIDGPSRAAFKYRQFIEYLPNTPPQYWQFIDPLNHIIGVENLEAIRSSEHLEATLIQQLLQVSMHLWANECLPFSKQDLFTMLSRSHLRALLTPALWSPSFQKPEADITQLHSLNDVLSLWQHALDIT